MISLAQGLTLLAAAFSLAAFYFSLIVHRKYEHSSRGWAFLAVAAGIIAFHRLAASAWAFGFFNASSDDFLGFSSIVFFVLSIVVLLAAWEVKKLAESHRLVDIKLLKKFAKEIEEEQAAAELKGKKRK